MKRALALARRGMGRVSPNPMVGAVIVKGGTIVGEGYHVYEKKEHAEVLALRRAGPEAAGATLYLNLEPCCHLGRTPPCVDEIIKAGIREVFISVRDRNPRVAGQGIQVLQEKGIKVWEGLFRSESLSLNEIFFHFVETGSPFVLLKLALSLDGKIAASGGDSKWITGILARREAHRLRYEHDAILVGVKTILTDDPALNVRWRRRNHITKVILDSQLQTPTEARVFESRDEVIIFHGKGVVPDRIVALSKRAKLFCVRKKDDVVDWHAVLQHLAELDITSVLIEGGSRIAASALKGGIVQKINLFYGPKLLGRKGLSGIDDLSIHRLSEAVHLRNVCLRWLPPDFLVEGYVKR